jgi:FkbM family methyltransferase
VVDSRLERLGWRVVAPVLGSRLGVKCSETLVKILMRGIGVNVGFAVDESGESWLVSRLLGQCRGAVCADVGANIGNYCELLVAHGAKQIVAFEPVPPTFARLTERSARLQGVSAVNAAVGERDGEVEIHVPRDPRHSSRDAEVAALERDGLVSFRVPLITLDSVCFDRDISFDFVKIDVEGFELEVLRGAARMLVERPPVALQIEFNRHHMVRRHHIGDFFDALPGYRLFRLAPRALFALRREHYLSTIYTFQNVVAIRNDRRDLMRALGG